MILGKHILLAQNCWVRLICETEDRGTAEPVEPAEPTEPKEMTFLLQLPLNNVMK